jgi:hypothetical protein
VGVLCNFDYHQRVTLKEGSGAAEVISGTLIRLAATVMVKVMLGDSDKSD